jgi:HD-like signal output (HDOD) protein
MSVLGHIRDLPDLPVLPQILLQVQSIAGSDEGDARKLSHIIERDPSLASKVLHVANSALFKASPHKVSSIQLAVSRLGFNEVRNLVIAMSLIRVFPSSFKNLDHIAFWRHSLMAAHLAQCIAQASAARFTGDGVSQCYTAGLLHDIGILIYDQFFHEEFGKIVRNAFDTEVSFLASEQELFPKEGHAFVGGVLGELWKLEEAVTAGIRYHHDPAGAPEKFRSIACAIFAAEFLLCNGALGSFEGTMAGNLDTASAAFSIAPERWAGFLGRAQQEADRCSMLVSAVHDQKDALRLV